MNQKTITVTDVNNFAWFNSKKKQWIMLAG